MATTKRGIEFLDSRTARSIAWRVRFPTADPDGGGELNLESWIYWQHGTVPRVGRNGFQPEELLELCAERLRELNGAVPSRETSTAITHVETAILWLEERTRDRLARGVEGTDVP